MSLTQYTPCKTIREQEDFIKIINFDHVTICVMQKSISITATCMILFMTCTSTAEARQVRSTKSKSSSFSPMFMTRTQWGADESLGIADETPEPQKEPIRIDEPIEASERDKKCQELLRKFPEDFQVRRIEGRNEYGQELSWARRYSPSIKAIVIHHTGEVENGADDTRTGIEHVRAIYKWHAEHNRWGDVGYNYLIDEEGIIYEGRAGGQNVVGAHVYCANVGTIGVALIGNFVRNYPKEDQLKSLRWLIWDLSQKYNLDPNGRTMFHGISMPTVVTHRDISLNGTLCAGRKMQKVLPKVRLLSAKGDFLSPILSDEERSEQRFVTDNSVKPLGATKITLAPRGVTSISLKYNASGGAVKSGESIIKVERSDSSLSLWQNRGGSRIRVRSDIRAEEPIRHGGSGIINLTVLAPRNSGSYTLNIGGTIYTIVVSTNRR